MNKYVVSLAVALTLGLGGRAAAAGLGIGDPAPKLEGKRAWIGHRMEMDKPLDQIVSGKYDVAKAAADYKKEQLEKTHFRAAIPEIQKFMQIAKGGDADKTIEAATKLIEGPCKDTSQ